MVGISHTAEKFVFLHRMLAIFLGIFILSHLAVHLTALAGPDTHIKWMNRARLIYKNPVTEPLLILALWVQVSIGVKLVRRRWRQDEKTRWGWIQILSGLYLGFFLIIHSGAALVTKYGFGLDTNFYWGAGTVNITPIKYIFAPYYVLGITAVFTHLAAALHFGWGTKGLRVAPVIIIFGIGLAVLIVAIFSGTFYDIIIPPEVIENFDKYMPG